LKISTKARYGINAMFELAKRYGEGIIPLKTIAEAQQIPEAYLEQLINQLRRDNLVKSSRGAMGGYELADSPQTITVGQVIYSLEGPMSMTGCLSEEDGQQCKREQCCPGWLVWSRISAAIDELFNEMTLQELVEKTPANQDEIR